MPFVDTSESEKKNLPTKNLCQAISCVRVAKRMNFETSRDRVYRRWKVTEGLQLVGEPIRLMNFLGR